jgi:hypothetical protein
MKKSRLAPPFPAVLAEPAAAAAMRREEAVRDRLAGREVLYNDAVWLRFVLSRGRESRGMLKRDEYAGCWLAEE